ncbi:16S rRNA (guanine(966)-N(2))-methyltransferase RsmD [Alkaliphilus hydrothermalis]|uniref:16S rRNA (Guanine(966)-N(2))-methyltransferase RsmD n=1 Tax=Alkaliphilus hydrothermalis TaxID=1482730 RepID=A0ABS2NSE0_9FIRM|nr:16S rRNA (guanine(966)-N(2))-methyltransferase RsmD [Alkaliphilus hydrothermalis]MBM7615836.1 16S rRNA (guanine(966)-N(2))-methyltransferase RsmD [Alkaliphilus hydrothermalis]
MRVISGKARGHRLKPPQGMDVRPTSDRVKESIFNIIQNYIIDSTVVDLFAGTGNLGIESLSRGAQRAYFVDQSRKSVETIKYNLEKTRLISSAEIISSDISSGIKRIAHKKVQADLIFMDPPYGKGLINSTLSLIVSTNLLKPSGLIVVEHDKNDEEILVDTEELTCIRKNNYGNTSISFYQLREETTK